MSDELRAQILFILDAYARTGSPYLKTDEELADLVGQSIDEIGRQLDILALDDLILLSKTHTSQSAAIKPKGTLLVERLKKTSAPPRDVPPREMGFRDTRD